MTHRILHLVLGKDGGTERFFVKLANAFHEFGAEQQFLIRPKRVWEKDVQNCGIVNYGWNSSNPILAWRMRRLISNWKPDAVVAWRAPQAKLLSKTSQPLTLTRLGDFPKSLKNFRNCDALVANVPQIVEHCLKLGWSKPIHLISNFPEFGETSAIDRDQLETPYDAYVVCGVGRFTKTKGFDALIRAVSKIPDTWLWLVGGGPEHDRLFDLVQQHEMSERTRIVGWVDDPKPYLASVDQFCLPSRNEPLGNVLLEAWSIGIPSSATLTDGPSWYATHEKDCLLVDIDDVGAMSHSIRRIRDNPALARALVAGAHETLETKFSKRAIVEQYFDLIEAHKAARI